MANQTTRRDEVSRAAGQTWEGHIRAEAQQWVQRLREGAVTELLGRRTSRRGAAVDGPSGDRNGDGKPRPRALSSGGRALNRRTPRNQNRGRRLL